MTRSILVSALMPGNLQALVQIADLTHLKSDLSKFHNNFVPIPLPGVQHGRRILVSVIEKRAQDDLNNTWVSVPVDENDLSCGFRDISYKELNKAANHAAHWLRQNLSKTTESFQPFAYAGPKDLRYSMLAVAAAKLQKVVCAPSLT